MKERIILHCDCNSFFASVETVLNPEYRGVPMAVCGSPEDRHGIVLAKNEEAKRYGIKTAETVYSAKRKCPELVIVSPHYDAYSEFSKLTIYPVAFSTASHVTIRLSILMLVGASRVSIGEPDGSPESLQETIKIEDITIIREKSK